MGEFVDKLLEAKYKNVPFFVRKETLNNIGQKQIVHDYPNSNTRYVEPQGIAIFEETVDIFFKGSDYINRFKDFMFAIQDPSPGRLFLPTYGIYNNVVAFPSQSISDHTTLGELSITVTFTETIEKPSPTEIFETKEDVASQAQIVRDNLLEVFTESYQAPFVRNNILTASSDLKNLAEETKTLTGAIIEFNRFTRSVDKVLRLPNSLASLLLNPGQPLGYLQSIALNTTGSEAFSLFTKIAIAGNNLSNSMNEINDEITPIESSVVTDVYTDSINTNINLWNENTTERRERNNNRLSVVNTFRVVGLVGMYEQAAEKEYTTTDQIDNIKNILEEYYVEIIENDTTGVIISDIKIYIDTLRNKTEIVLDQKRQNAFSVIEIVIKNMIPATLLAYQLYGEYIKTIAEFNFLTELLRGLNKQLPAHKMQGMIRVVEID